MVPYPLTPVVLTHASPQTVVSSTQPAMGLSTPLVFKNLDLTQLSKVDPRDLLNSFSEKLKAGLPVPPECYVNDLEPPAFKCVPELQDIKESLLVGCRVRGSKRRGRRVFLVDGRGGGV